MATLYETLHNALYDLVKAGPFYAVTTDSAGHVSTDEGTHVEPASILLDEVRNQFEINDTDGMSLSAQPTRRLWSVRLSWNQRIDLSAFEAKFSANIETLSFVGPDGLYYAPVPGTKQKDPPKRDDESTTVTYSFALESFVR